MKLFLLIVLFLLMACGEQDPELRIKIFDNCLMRAAEARKGQSYTTSDDEDYDEVISACGNQAYHMSFKKKEK